VDIPVSPEDEELEDTGDFGGSGEADDDASDEYRTEPDTKDEDEEDEDEDKDIEEEVVEKEIMVRKKGKGKSTVGTKKKDKGKVTYVLALVLHNGRSHFYIKRPA
jgi:hypothetical protein